MAPFPLNIFLARDWPLALYSRADMMQPTSVTPKTFFQDWIVSQPFDSPKQECPASEDIYKETTGRAQTWPHPRRHVSPIHFLPVVQNSSWYVRDDCVQQAEDIGSGLCLVKKSSDQRHHPVVTFSSVFQFVCKFSYLLFERREISQGVGRCLRSISVSSEGELDFDGNLDGYLRGSKPSRSHFSRTW